MYTSYSKIDDRFGFSTGGTFHCAYKNTRTIITVCLAIIGVLFVLTIINAAYVFIKLGDAPADIAKEMEHMIYGIGGIGGADLDKEDSNNAAVYNSMINVGFGISGTAFGILLLAIALVGFLVFFAIMRAGQIYRFSANETHFTVEYPKRMNRKLVMEYDYIIGLKYEEWRFMFAPKCLDVTVQTKSGDFTFRVIHTPLSKANGITETPFNIIRERIGLAGDDEDVLINKEASKDQKPGFFS